MSFRTALSTFNMTSRTISSAPFSKAVVNAMRKLYPEALADKSWDNTGLLLEAPFDPNRRQKNSVLLAIDLTKAVADEAIERQDSIIVAYHPIIFRGLKSITFDNTQQQSLLRLAAAGISVYSPHTAIDAAAGGLGDWLADIITGTSGPEQAKDTTETSSGGSHYILHHQPLLANQPQSGFKLASVKHSREPIKASNLPDAPGAGMGRIVRFDEPQPLASIIDRVGRGIGGPKAFPVAIPQGSSVNDISISSVGICAGSGGSLFAGLDVDLLFTGELSHHEALAAVEKGQSVISLFHSNSERGFLHNVLKPQLLDTVKEEWERSRSEEKAHKETAGAVVQALDDSSVSVHVSERDRDPYGIVISSS